ncbi:MAG: AAA family ATPase [Myxococcota bacterium]|nr:AAA family ATPase [Myxococcota bacterium]
MTSLFIKRVTLRNYKSVRACQFDLPNLAFFVGPNGSGKSNFLDAFRFVSDSLKTSLDHALRDRGTIKEVRRRSGGHPNHFAIRLDFQLAGRKSGHLSFRVGAKPNNRFEVQAEECRIFDPSTPLDDHYYEVVSGEVQKASKEVMPAALSDRLFLVAASGLQEFRPVFDALSSIEVYNLNPNMIGALQKPDPGDLLRRDGGNLASVLSHLSDKDQKHINGYLSRIFKGLSSTKTKALGSMETIEFRQVVKGQKYPWQFDAASMSDGTLRALGILVAIFQGLRKSNDMPLLVGLEEPEMALHPAAAGVLLGALRDAASHTQILVTSHSPDLLDDEDLEPESIFAVDNIDGITYIAGIDEAGKQMIRERLFTAGELLRDNQLATDASALSEISDDRQLKLFDADDK